MRQENNTKQDLIVNAAIRRFSHFGIGKTTMTEIAEDVKLSKQSLSYYFPEKLSLIQAVESKIIDEYFQLLEQNIQNAACCADALTGVVDVKEALIERYYMLAIQDDSREAFASNARKNNAREQLVNRFIEAIAKVIQRGIEKGEFRKLEPHTTAALMYEIMESHQHCALHKSALPDMKHVHNTMKKQKEILELLVNGLKQS